MCSVHIASLKRICKRDYIVCYGIVVKTWIIQQKGKRCLWPYYVYINVDNLVEVARLRHLDM